MVGPYDPGVETLRLILLFVHILGFAALIGGLVAQAGPGEKKVNAAMRDGAGTAFLAGLPQADLNGDGFHALADVSAFVAGFLQGCDP